MAEKTGLEVCKLLFIVVVVVVVVVDTLSVTGSPFALALLFRDAVTPWRLVNLEAGVPSTRLVRGLGSAAEGVVDPAASDRRIRRDAPPMLALVRTLILSCASFRLPTYLAGVRRIRPEQPEGIRVRTAGDTCSAAFRMAPGYRTQSPGRVRWRPASRRSRLGRSPTKRLLVHRPWDQCPRPCRHGSVVRRTWAVWLVPGRPDEREVTGGDLLDVVHGRDGFLRILLVGVSHETEASTTAGVAIFDNHLARNLLGSACHRKQRHATLAGSRSRDPWSDSSLPSQAQQGRGRTPHQNEKRTATYCFFHHPILFKLLSQRRFFSVPCEATAPALVGGLTTPTWPGSKHPGFSSLLPNKQL